MNEPLSPADQQALAVWKNAFMDLESELCDARNMERLTAFIIDDCSDPDLLAFAVCHTAHLADDLHKKWDALSDQLSMTPTP
jgi:hypothetical protein